MFRRGISLLTIVGFLASQGGTIPHAHGRMTAENSAITTLARMFISLTMTTTMMMGDMSIRMTDNPWATSLGSKEQAPQPQRSPDHDSSAVFVTNQVVATRTTWQNDHDVFGVTIALLAALPIPFVELGNTPPPSPRWHPPDKVLDESDVYLTLRNLRI